MVDCKACKGKGLNPDNYAELCAKCKGSGKVVDPNVKETPKK